MANKKNLKLILARLESHFIVEGFCRPALPPVGLFYLKEIRKMENKFAEIIFDYYGKCGAEKTLMTVNGQERFIIRYADIWEVSINDHQVVVMFYQDVAPNIIAAEAVGLNKLVGDNLIFSQQIIYKD
jgi:hypothetical protein